jgi:hypothetical protein
VITVACLHAGFLAIAKELNITPVLDKIQDYKRNLIQHVNRMPHNRLLRLIKNYTPKRNKEPRKTIEETYGCVRLEQVNKRPISFSATSLVTGFLSSLVLLLLSQW